MLGKNSRAAKLFDVKVNKTDKNAACIEWSKVEATRDWTTLSAGCYLLRTNVADWSDEELWKAYIQLTEAEAAFRIHKSDLSIRPIWHQKEIRTRCISTPTDHQQILLEKLRLKLPSKIIQKKM